jgi:hypothetical protein
VDEGPGETRAALVEGGALVEMRIARDGDGPPAGARLEGRLKSRTGAAGIVDLGDGIEAVIAPWPAGLAEGARLPVDVTRAAWREPGRDRLARVRPARGAAADEADQPERVRHGWPREVAQAWEEAWETALLGRRTIPGGRLHFTPTPAFTAVDVDGAGDGLAEAAVAELARAIRLWELGGSIVIDLPGLANAAARAKAGALFDAAMTLPFERTAINGFGLMQVVRPRRRPSILERARLEPAANTAIALLRAALRDPRPGPLRLVCRPDVAQWLEARPHLLARLARDGGRRVDVVRRTGVGEGHVDIG